MACCAAGLSIPAMTQLRVIRVAVSHRRAVVHVRSASDSDRFLCVAANDAKGHKATSCSAAKLHSIRSPRRRGRVALLGFDAEHFGGLEVDH